MSAGEEKKEEKRAKKKKKGQKGTRNTKEWRAWGSETRKGKERQRGKNNIVSTVQLSTSPERVLGISWRTEPESEYVRALAC